MAIGSTALANLIIILIIGALVGLAFNRYAHSWLARLGSTTRSDVTTSLVGIAGAFIGFRGQEIARAVLGPGGRVGAGYDRDRGDPVSTRILSRMISR
jgi:hypothetical protein